MMDNSPLFIVLPFFILAFMLGVFLGRKKHEKNPSASSSYTLSSDYFKGLNYLLNEQTDKAINVFVGMLEVGEETVDTHISLGNLYRQRGEVEQAIKIHQNVIAKPSLSLVKRNDALYELAKDFMNAGLLDRAENLFQELIKKQSHVSSALKYLLSIYQQEHDWQNAILIAKKLESASNKSYTLQVSHFYCELALISKNNGHLKEALKLVKKALGTNKQSVRASIIEGEIYHSLKNCKAATRAYRRVEQQDPLMLSEVLESLLLCYKELKNYKEIKSYLDHVLNKYEGVTSVLLYAQQLQHLKDDKTAALFIVESLRKKPSIRGLSSLIDISLDFTKGTAHDNLVILKEITDKLLEDKPVYHCTQCGFNSKSIYWQCPSCKSWSSIKPIQGIEGE
ncbi:MAG: lipopolysaccharide assembly protein LapB [gamma proteobacterium symbiont of Bathyaustriella thionipta]|nr:lipopolysaccharide assembly protein LapB [gamma proteobacterium symbiont of Bathyaustriella thionipta]MCU7949230.1 lipopolysaccharide assembly protein LapB [gamma proteobacterium symbiont of Bathyaustriella thionipta]MCU7954810.1 lipopolysaccharide assembly protein LapB [gamma proteobacterium symbiont of Bathyaustriella thionipta]MCU7955828.1 lipopolysaccharide assembly protein LapB [gamma proteobacterium symbiont of Bathyaustriella thionipta]MCU7967257.1 lipopolysaccharide assembly protein 